VRNATVRAVIRHRVRFWSENPVALTMQEARKYGAFMRKPFSQHPVPSPAPTGKRRGLRTPADAEMALHWAAFKLFSTFFDVLNIEAVIMSSAAHRADAVADEQSGGSSVDSMVDSVSVGNSNDTSASEYSSDELRMSEEEGEITNEGGDDSVVGGADDHVGDQAAVVFSAPDARAAESASGPLRAGSAGIEKGLQHLALDRTAPTSAAGSTASLPSTPLPDGDGTKFLLSSRAGAEGNEEQATFESIFAQVDKTSCP